MPSKPKSKDIIVYLRIPKAMHAAIAQAAKRDDMTQSAIIRRVLAKAAL